MTNEAFNDYIANNPDWDPADAIATPSTALSPFSSNYYMPVGDNPGFGENLKAAGEGLRIGGDWIQDKASQYLPHNMLLNWLTGDKEAGETQGERISYPQKDEMAIDAIWNSRDKKLERLRRKAEETYYKARAFEFQDRI